MPALAAELGGADSTLSSSYHVALTSLLLGVPAILPRDNDYYDQKARGLLGDFDLPAKLSPRSTDDPVQVAAALSPLLLETAGREGAAAASSRPATRCGLGELTSKAGCEACSPAK